MVKHYAKMVLEVADTASPRTRDVVEKKAFDQFLNQYAYISSKQKELSQCRTLLEEEDFELLKLYIIMQEEQVVLFLYAMGRMEEIMKYGVKIACNTNKPEK